MRQNRWRTMFSVVLALVLCAAAAVAYAATGIKLTYDAAGHLTEVLNLSSDPNNCGSKGYVCQPPSNGQECCVTGVCGTINGTQCIPEDCAVVVGITPTAATVGLGQTQQFTATVQGASDTFVAWQVNGITGGYNAVGTIDGLGLYTAPEEIPSVAVFVTAVSNACATKFATVSVIVVPPDSVTPRFAVLWPRETRIFTASFEDSSDLELPCDETAQASVRWQVEGIPGGNDTVGVICNGVYSAPSSDSQGLDGVTITAISNTDSGRTATATVKLWRPPPITVDIAPLAASVQEGQSFSFAAIVDAPPYFAQGVHWLVDGELGGYPEIGTISDTGVFTAPDMSALPQVTITAASVEDTGCRADAVVTIQPSPSIQIQPVSASVQLEQTLQFTAAVLGSPSTAVAWKVNDIEGGNSMVGTIDATGLFTAPVVVPSPATITITAVYLADNTLSASSTVTITQLPPVYIEETSLGSIILRVGQTMAYSVHVRNAEDTTLTWQVNGITGGNNTVGTVTPEGVYAAPTAASDPFTATITATANADSTKTVSGVVTVTPIPPIMLYVNNGGIVMDPSITYHLLIQQQTRFYAIVRNATESTVTWQVNGVTEGNRTVGTIDEVGNYSAPAAVPVGTDLYVIAVLNSDPKIWFPVRLSIDEQ